MTEAVNPWGEEEHFRRDAINGSRKLLIAIMRSQGIYLWQRPKRQRDRPRGTSGLFERNAKVSKFEGAVAEHFGIDPADIHLLTRREKYAHPRQIVMYLAHEFGNASFPEIGRHFGKDHTTALHACRAVKADWQRLAAAQMIFAKMAPEPERLAA